MVQYRKDSHQNTTLSSVNRLMEDDIALRSLEESVKPSATATNLNLVDRFEESQSQVSKASGRNAGSLMNVVRNPMFISGGSAAALVLILALYLRPPIVTKQCEDGGDEEEEERIDIGQLAMWVGGSALAAVVISRVWKKG
jgi:hypothetical protein